MQHPERNLPALLAPWRRVCRVAEHTLTEALSLRLTVLLAAAGTLLMLMATWLREFNFGYTELKFICDFGLGATSLMGVMLAALVTAHLYFSDINGGVIGCLLTRTLRRWEYIAGKLTGIMTLLALFVAGLFLVLIGVLLWRQRELGWAVFPLLRLLQAGGLIWLKLTLVAAMTLLVSTYAGSMLFAACAGLMLTIVAHLRPIVEGGHGIAVLRFWPNLAMFDVEPLLAGAGLDFGGLLLYWGLFMVIFTSLSVFVCERREF